MISEMIPEKIRDIARFIMFAIIFLFISVRILDIFGILPWAKPIEHTVAEKQPEVWTRIVVGKSPVLISDSKHKERFIVLVNESRTLIAVGGPGVTIFDGFGLLGTSPSGGDGGVLEARTAIKIHAVAWEEGSILAYREKPSVAEAGMEIPE